MQWIPLIHQLPEEKVWFIWATLKMCSNDKVGQEARVENFHSTNYNHLSTYFYLKFLMICFGRDLEYIKITIWMNSYKITRLNITYILNKSQIRLFIPGIFLSFRRLWYSLGRKPLAYYVLQNLKLVGLFWWCAHGLLTAKTQWLLRIIFQYPNLYFSNRVRQYPQHFILIRVCKYFDAMMEKSTGHRNRNLFFQGMVSYIPNRSKNHYNMFKTITCVFSCFVLELNRW